jgi:hypothetical protein
MTRSQGMAQLEHPGNKSYTKIRRPETKHIKEDSRITKKLEQCGIFRDALL